MKTILIGNGFNIHIEKTFKNELLYSKKEIMKRFLNNYRVKKYQDLFQQYSGMIEIPSFDDIELFLNKLIQIVEEIIQDKKQKLASSQEEKKQEKKFQNVYRIGENYIDATDIGMEDFFFILHLFCNKYKSKDIYYPLFTVLQWMFLDAIYNDGKIEELHSYLPIQYKAELELFFRGFTHVFTVNYDNNLEMIANRKIHYLHGNFKLLNDVHNKDSLLGKSQYDRGNLYKVEDKNKHMFSSAILGHTGDFKLKQMEVSSVFLTAMKNHEKMMNSIENPIEAFTMEMKLLKAKSSEKEEEQLLYYGYNNFKSGAVFINNNYPIDMISDIEGELHILGMSPNNDNHIWEKISSNNKLSIIYYYYNYNDVKIIKMLYPTINIKFEDVSQLWSKMNKYSFA